MFVNKLTMTKNFIKLLEIEDPDNFRSFNLDFRELRETLDYSKIFGGKGNIGINSHLDFLNKIEDEYGSFAKLAYWYHNLRDYAYEPDGSYHHMFNGEQLTTDICQRVPRGEYFDLDILKTMGKELEFFIQKCGYLSSSRLNVHFGDVKIQCDDRSLITYQDMEHEKKVEKILEVLKASEYRDEVEIEVNETSFRDIVFMNDRETEIFNVEELKNSSDVLVNMLEEFNIENELEQEFNRLYSKYEEQCDLVNIELYVCTPEIVTDPMPTGTYFFNDMPRHPKYILKEFKKAIDKYREGEYSKMVVHTYSQGVVNYIRYLVSEDSAELFENHLDYYDENNKKHTFNIQKSGQFEPSFPSGFFDFTLEDIQN